MARKIVATFVLIVQVYVNVPPGNGFPEEISVGPLTLKKPVIELAPVPSPVTKHEGATLGEKNNA